MHASSDRQEIAKYLPYLRRYARMLTGTQEGGDRLVRLCLETYIVEADHTARNHNVRLSLYRLFHEVWRKLADFVSTEIDQETASAGVLEEHILALAPIERQALLLTTLEPFSVEDAAYILGITADEARRFLRKAREQLTAQTATTVLVIEDEPVIAFDIANIVAEMGHQVVGNAQTKDEAIVIAAAERPGVVLADIQLGDGSSGIDAVAEILKFIEVPTIFITAYPERLLTGEGVEPAYLVTKPFDPATLRVTMNQALLLNKHPVAASIAT